MTTPKGIVYGPRADAKIQRTVREVARRLMNETPHRGRWMQRQQDVQLVEGLVVACFGDGWYEIELAEWDQEPPASQYSGNTGVEDCDLCSAVQAAYPITPGECQTIPVKVDRTRPIGTGVYVYAHDARRIPLEDDGHVRMLKSHTAADGEQLYAIISGEYKLLRQAIPDYECCDGAVTLVGCDYIITEGVACDGWRQECPS